MVIAILIILGLCLGSFVNALVYRLFEQNKGSNEPNNNLSIFRGRSICPNCQHLLAPKDLIPVISWLSLSGKCRYCKQPISWLYPLVELITAVLFVFSYLYWPHDFSTQGTLMFVFWLMFLTSFVALGLYDLKHYVLPNRIIYFLLGLALLETLLLVVFFESGVTLIKNAALGAAVGGGIFYVLFQISGGKWIGGGDVKLGTVIGLIVASPQLSLLVLFIASCAGSIVSLPLLVTGKAKRGTRLPFGPFLIIGAIVAYLFGTSIINWYKTKFLVY